MSQDVKIVREFLDMFLKELPGLPLDQEIKFTIDLISRTTSISKWHCMKLFMEESIDHRHIGISW